MLMIGERNGSNPSVQIPPQWSLFDDPTAEMVSPHHPVSGVTNGNGDSGEYSPFLLAEALSELQRYLPSNDESDRESDVPVDAYSCDEFRMYEFKVRRCARGRSHDWTECPYAHPGEKARRRDPRKFHYSGTACPDFRKGNCKRGDACEYAHGVFECWLHPARYRTQPCKDGTSCRRRVCFFAHTPDQLRVLPQQAGPRVMAESPPSYDGSPLRQAMDSYFAKGSPNSTLFTPPISPPSDSPPMSPSTQSPLSRPVGSNSSITDIVGAIRHLQLSKVKSVPPLRGGVQLGGSGFGSPRGVSNLRPVCNSLPSTPTDPTHFWERGGGDLFQQEPVMDRVESGRELRTKIFEKLSKENSLERSDRVDSPATGPDVGWVSELVK